MDQEETSSKNNENLIPSLFVINDILFTLRSTPGPRMNGCICKKKTWLLILHMSILSKLNMKRDHLFYGDEIEKLTGEHLKTYNFIVTYITRTLTHFDR